MDIVLILKLRPWFAYFDMNNFNQHIRTSPISGFSEFNIINVKHVN